MTDKPLGTSGSDEPPEKRYQQLVEAAGDVFFICDPYGSCTYINRAVEQLYGYKPEAVIGKHFTEFIHPDWREKILGFYMEQFRSRQTQTRCEFPAITREGEEKWVEQIVVLLPDGDRVGSFQGFVRDIHERKQQERLFLSNRLTMDAMVQHTIDLVFMKNRDLRYEVFNPAGEAMTGLSASDVIGKTDYDLFGTEIGDEMGRLDREILETGEPKTYEIERMLMGEQRTLSITKYPFIDADETVLGVIGVGRDITERIRAEASLKALMNNTEDSIYSINTEMRILALNSTFQEKFYEALKVKLEVGMCALDYLGATQAAEWKALYSRVLGGESFSAQQYFPTVNIYADMHFNPIRTTDGQIVGATIFSRNITAYKEAEAAREAYLDQLEVLQYVNSELMQELNFSSVLTLALEAAVSLSGANAGAIHLVDEHWLRVAKTIGNYPPEQENARIARSQGIVGRVMRTQKAELTLDVSNDPDYVAGVATTKAQITVPLIARNQPFGTLNVQTDDPTLFTEDIFRFVELLSGSISVALDNARQYTEMRLLYQQKTELEKLKTQLIKLAAHDLKNPLTVALGGLMMVEMLLQDAPEKLRYYIREGSNSLKKMNKIIENLLTMERAQDGVVKVPFDLSKVIQAGFEDNQEEASGKQLNFRLEMSDEPMPVFGDDFLLKAAVSNLVHNAVKYTGDGGQVMARAWVEDKAVMFEVRDTGFGIPQEKQSDLFKDYNRVVTPETAGIPGSGLGLNLVKSIINRHSGNIEFESEYKKGSIFRFSLPLMEAGDETQRNNPFKKSPPPY